MLIFMSEVFDKYNNAPLILRLITMNIYINFFF